MLEKLASSFCAENRLKVRRNVYVPPHIWLLALKCAACANVHCLVALSKASISAPKRPSRIRRDPAGGSSPASRDFRGSVLVSQIVQDDRMFRALGDGACAKSVADAVVLCIYMQFQSGLRTSNRQVSCTHPVQCLGAHSLWNANAIASW